MLSHCAGEEGIERSRIATAIRDAQLGCASRLRIGGDGGSSTPR
jgi:hypothetical protein